MAPPRRSPRLRLQALDLRRRSARLHPEIQHQEARRRSPRLHPEMHAGEEVGVGLTRRIRRHRTRTSLASLPDEMLREILLRLPPLPSSLPRASAVCKRWRGVVTDPRFRLQFYAHGRKPPLLGYLHKNRRFHGIESYSVLDPPDRIPPPRLEGYFLLDCRHGLFLLLQDNNPEEVVVRDLITQVERRVAVPPELVNGGRQGAVLCAAAAAADHVHGSCHSSPFKVVLVCSTPPDYRPIAGVYSSETGLWSNIISTEAQYLISPKPVVLVGNCLYWMTNVDGILEFGLDDKSLTVIRGPPVKSSTLYHNHNCKIIEAEDGALGLAKLSYPHFQLWQRNVNACGVDTWVLSKTIEMHSIPGLPPQIDGKNASLVGYDQDTDVLYLHASDNVYRIQLKLMQSKKLYENRCFDHHVPFKSFYTPGTTIAGELNGAEMLHDA